jgi:hypothetical protein
MVPMQGWGNSGFSLLAHQQLQNSNNQELQESSEDGDGWKPFPSTAFVIENDTKLQEIGKDASRHSSLLVWITHLAICIFLAYKLVLYIALGLV